MSSAKKACICAICVALCYGLPMAFHSLSLGSALSPMHLPILLCGLVCGWHYGAICGIAGPVLSSLLSSMPPAIKLIYMVPELCVYGLTCGLLMKLIRTGRSWADLYLSLIPALLLGRIAGGIARALFYLFTAQGYSMAIWASGYLVGGIPAIILHLIVLPPLILALTQSRIISARYPKVKRTAP